jgi:flagellar hook-associated protein 2
MLNIDGLASGLDTTSIIEGLLSIRQSQIDRFNARKEEVVQQQTAFRGIEARLLSLKSSMGNLTRPGLNAFDEKTIVTSDESAVEASVSSNAATGLYSFRVNQLAKNHQVATQGFSDRDAVLAHGTLSIAVGAGAPIELAIDESNDSLDNLARKINTDVSGVTASIVQDASGSRLLLSSNKTGTDNAVNVSFTVDTPGEESFAPTFDLNNPVQAAANAEIQIGSGTGAIVTNSQSNTVDDLFSGVTISLRKADPDQELSITVARDTDGTKQAIRDFVDAYNSVVEYTAEQNQLNGDTGEASLLFGNRALLTVRDRLGLTVTSAVPLGTGNPINRLSSIGIRLDASNHLTINSSDLDAALNGRIGNTTVSESQLKALFGNAGESESEFVQFLSATSNTSMESIKVRITNAAQQARIESTNTIADSVVIDDSNDTFSVNLDGAEAKDLKLRHGTYTADELAEELELQINSSEELRGRQVNVTVANQKLQIHSVVYGQRSQVGQFKGSATSALGMTGDEFSRGENVAGEFIYTVDGEEKIEQAQGDGRTLTGTPADPSADQPNLSNGLRVRITLSESQVAFDSPYETTLNLTRGIAESLEDTIDDLLLDRGNQIGPVASTFDEFESRIASIDESIETLNTRFDAEEQSLLRQFTALESRIAELQSLGSIMAAQLASLPSINANRR